MIYFFVFSSWSKNSWVIRILGLNTPIIDGVFLNSCNMISTLFFICSFALHSSSKFFRFLSIYFFPFIFFFIFSSPNIINTKLSKIPAVHKSGNIKFTHIFLFSSCFLSSVLFCIIESVLFSAFSTAISSWLVVWL